MKMYRNSLNLYNSAETEIIRGYIDDEGISHSSTSGTTAYTQNFTKVSASSKYYLRGTVGSHRIYYYDANKTFISRSEGMTASRERFDTIANCEYIQIQFEWGNTTNDWMLTLSAPHSFEPYNVVDWYGYTYKLRASGAWTDGAEKKRSGGAWV